MLDKTKNLFTCDKDGKRYPVCSHVRAWVKTQMADEYTKGYAAGRDATRYCLGDHITKLSNDEAMYLKDSLSREIELLERLQEKYYLGCFWDGPKRIVLYQNIIKKLKIKEK